MSAADDVARMLTLVPWLLERPGASVEEAADAFDVDADTIRRDLGHLDFCGLPGLGGGDLFEVSVVGDRIVVRMADELRRPMRVTAREALEIVLTAEAVGEAFGEELPHLDAALAKVRAALGIPSGVAAQVASGGARWLRDARRALSEGRRVRFDYQGRRDERPRARRLDPWVLHVADGDWYLQGHDPDAAGVRTFRLDRVADLVVTDEPIATPSPPTRELPAPRYTPAPGDVEVELELGAGAAWVTSHLDPDVVEELEGGGLRVVVPTDAPDYVVRLVLSAGPDARVVAPGWLAGHVAERAHAALTAYRQVPNGG